MTTFNVQNYWENRYKNGGNSGWGSHNESSVSFKKDYVNNLILELGIKTVVELGCGDGNQLSFFENYDTYTGYDISNDIITKCIKKFSGDDTKSFTSDINNLAKNGNKYDIALSLDVVYHLVEDSVYESYMHVLFGLSDNICIFGTDNDNAVSAIHVKNRKISEFVTKHYPNFKLCDTKPFNENVGFYFYKKDV